MLQIIMEIKFQTKEESNRQQLENFLKLSGAERFYSFLRLSERLNHFPVKNYKSKNSKNFIIEIKSSKNENLGK